MREGSYASIKKGMRVVGPEGETIGGVLEVLVDEGSGIFVGLSVRPNLFAHAVLVPGDRVERLHDGVVHVTTTGAELQPYNTPAERFHEVEQAHDAANS